MGKAQQLLFLSLEDVVAAGATDMGKACSDIEKGFETYYKQKIVQPFKTSLWKPEQSSGNQIQDSSVNNGFVNIMPAIVFDDTHDIYGCKLLGSMYSNVNLGLPRATGLIVLFDSNTKIPLAVMDAQVISAIRTGAASGVAAKYLAPDDTKSIALIGAGLQMRTQLLALIHCLPNLRRVFVYSRGGSKHCFATEMGAHTGIEIVASSDIQTLVEENKMLIICVPMSVGQIIESDWLNNKGVTIFNISGANTPPIALQKMDRLIADNWNDFKHRGTNESLVLAVDQKLVNEEKIEDFSTIVGSKQGRRNRDENIFFCPVGMAFEDVMVASRIYKTALARGIGQKLTLWENSQWL